MMVLSTKGTGERKSNVGDESPGGHHREGIKKMTREEGEGWGSLS